MLCRVRTFLRTEFKEKRTTKSNNLTHYDYESLFSYTKSQCDGETLFCVTPCKTLKKAKEIMREKINTLLNESLPYQDYATHPDAYIVEQTETSYYIEDRYDDYSETINIEKKVIL